MVEVEYTVSGTVRSRKMEEMLVEYNCPNSKKNIDSSCSFRLSYYFIFCVIKLHLNVLATLLKGCAYAMQCQLIRLTFGPFQRNTVPYIVSVLLFLIASLVCYSYLSVRMELLVAYVFLYNVCCVNCIIKLLRCLTSN